MKVRIGNDLCFLVTLSSAMYEINILSLKVYMVNKTYVNTYRRPTAYNINGSLWRSSYNCYPLNSNLQTVVGNIYSKDPWANKYSCLVPATFTSKTNLVKVYFPAELQFTVGNYDMVIVAQVYHEGYPDNLKTITIDRSNVFTLVDNTDEADNNSETATALDQSSTSTSPYQSLDVYVENGEYIGDNIIQLNLTDGRMKYVDTTLATGWYIGD